MPHPVLAGPRARPPSARRPRRRPAPALAGPGGARPAPLAHGARATCPVPPARASLPGLGPVPAMAAMAARRGPRRPRSPVLARPGMSCSRRDGPDAASSSAQRAFGARP
jgi:hypothetical protein